MQFRIRTYDADSFFAARRRAHCVALQGCREDFYCSRVKQEGYFSPYGYQILIEKETSLDNSAATLQWILQVGKEKHKI